MGGRRNVTGSAQPQTTAPATVPVSSIALNPRNPRADYNDVAELAESVSQVGVLQPLGVVRYEVFLTHYPEYEHEVGACDWVVINGNRRLAASHKAGLEKVPVHVLDQLGRGEALDESVLIENIHREALPPLREAEALRILVKRHGSQRAVANRIAKTNGYISQRIALLSLEPSLQESLINGQLRVREARQLAKLPLDEQTAEWARLQRGVYPVNTAEQATDGAGDDYAGVYPVNTRSQQQGHTRQKHTLRLESPEQIAADLKRRLSKDDLRALRELLTV